MQLFCHGERLENQYVVAVKTIELRTGRPKVKILTQPQGAVDDLVGPVTIYILVYLAE